MFSKLRIKLLLKILGVLFVCFTLVIILSWFLLPSYLKDYIEENDTTWINREISIEKIEINPFTTTVQIFNTTIKEPNSSTNFISCKNVKVNFDFWSLLQSKINTQEITLTNFTGSIIQNGNQFNFSDLFESKKGEDKDDDALTYKLRNISILESTLSYTNKELGSTHVLDSIYINDQIFTSTDTFFNAQIKAHQPEGGNIMGEFVYDFETDNYKIDATVNTWQLSPFTDYITSVIRLSKFDGQLKTALQINGNTVTDFIKISGKMSVSDFKMIDPENKLLLSFGDFQIDINEINSTDNIYDFKDIILNDSQLSFEYLPNGNNFTKWLVGANSSTKTNTQANVVDYGSPFKMLSVYIYDMTKEYIFKSYSADKIQFSNFNLKFYDYTLEDPFYMDLSEITITSNNIQPKNQYANFHLNGKMNRKAIVEGDVSVSRRGFQNMTANMSVQGLILNRFSPYGRFYAAHRFLEGISSFRNKSIIKDSYLTSENILHIENIQVSKKDQTTSGSYLPLRLAVALMKDPKGNINLEIPVEGPINDPNYKFGKVIWQVIKNIFTKLAISPIKALSNAFKINEDDLKNIYFDNGQISLARPQKKSLNSIANVLDKKPEFNIELNYLYNKEYEMDLIALKNAKIDYLKQSNLSLDNSIPIGKHAFDLSNADPDFLTYLKKITPNYDETISIPENTRRLLGEEELLVLLQATIAKQKQLIQDYLMVEKSIPENRFKIIDLSTTAEALSQTHPKFEVKFEVEE